MHQSDVAVNPPAAAITPELGPSETPASVACRIRVMVLLLLLLRGEETEKDFIGLRMEGPHEATTGQALFLKIQQEITESTGFTPEDEKRYALWKIGKLSA